MTPLPACMGGWCRQRQACADYHATHRPQVAERLCPKGQDNPQHVRVPPTPTKETA